MLFNCWDPRGNNVVLDRRVFDNHILARHGDEVTAEDIQYAIENPDLITADLTDPMVEIYYAQGAVESADPTEYLKVCVRYKGDGLNVVTAYLVDRPKLLERVIWHSKQ